MDASIQGNRAGAYASWDRENTINNQVSFEVSDNLYNFLQQYSISFHSLLSCKTKTFCLFSDYKEYNTDTVVHFVITMSREKLIELERDGLHKAFKLQTTASITSMVCFYYFFLIVIWSCLKNCVRLLLQS